MVITPGSVIRRVFDRAFDHTAMGNVLYGLPGGLLIPGSPPPKVLTLDREEGAIRSIKREDLLSADVIVTNFHSLGDGQDPDDLLAKLRPEDVDMIVVDEAHMAAAESYQRTFAHFADARTLLMSACFRRLDGRPIESDVVYRYLLIDSIADGNAKSLRVTRFSPDASQTTYEMIWPDNRREEIVGREVLLELIEYERKLAGITAKSEEPIRQVEARYLPLLESRYRLGLNMLPLCIHGICHLQRTGMVISIDVGPVRRTVPPKCPTIRCMRSTFLFAIMSPLILSSVAPAALAS